MSLPSKLLLCSVFFGCSAAVFAQASPPVQVVAPGCGDKKTKLDVKTDRSQHPFAKPDPGKALIYFLQDDSGFLSAPRPTTRFGLDGNWVGATQSNAYFYLPVDPGEHHLCASWQSFVGSISEISGAAHLNAEAGASYFFLVRNHWIRDHGPAKMDFAPVDSDQAQLLMTKFGFSSSRARK